METNLTLQNAAWIWPSAEFTRNQRANFFLEFVGSLIKGHFEKLPENYLQTPRKCATIL